MSLHNNATKFKTNIYVRNFRENIDYIENQCTKPLPDCSYTSSKNDVTVVAMDDILYSRTVQDCERFCDDVSSNKLHRIEWPVCTFFSVVYVYDNPIKCLGFNLCNLCASHNVILVVKYFGSKLLLVVKYYW